jgi:hypothetical protein
MRAQRRLALSLLLVTGGLSIAMISAPASAAPPSNLTLKPAEGGAGSTVTAEFRLTGLQPGVCTRLRVTFRWDGQEIGQNNAGNCTASVRFKPPRNDRAAGPHQVSASGGNQAGFAFFTITGGDATSTPTSTPTGRATATATGHATPTYAAASDPALPVPTDRITGSVVPPPALDAAAGVASGGSSSFTSLTLLFGGVLVLGGVGILAFVIMRMRRGEEDPEPADGPRDYPTQMIDAGYPAIPRHAEYSSRFDAPE